MSNWGLSRLIDGAGRTATGGPVVTGANRLEAQDATNTSTRIQNDGANDLGHLYPDLISLRAQFDDDLQEVNSRDSCELPAMRQNRAFLNDLSNIVDAYDAYVRDGLSPWADKMKPEHSLIEQNLEFRQDRSKAD